MLRDTWSGFCSGPPVSTRALLPDELAMLQAMGVLNEDDLVFDVGANIV